MRFEFVAYDWHSGMGCFFFHEKKKQEDFFFSLPLSGKRTYPLIRDSGPTCAALQADLNDPFKRVVIHETEHGRALIGPNTTDASSLSARFP